jgi:Amt family ammonium transporter
MGALVLGALGGLACFWGVTSLKKSFGYDESLDVFGIHGIGGIVGAIGTGVFVSPALGGVGVDGYEMGSQVMTQTLGVLIAVGWSGAVSLVLFKLIDMTIGLRVTEEDEREGLDTTSHGERAYYN